jgi:serine/threonine protein kinase
VAVKAIPVQSLTKDSIDEINAEANIMRRLSHPRIVSCFGVFQYNGNHCIVMELMSSGSLQDSISLRPCPDSWLTRYNIALDICNGTGYLHKLNVIHRDLKPGNIVLDTYGRAKITDFGLSIVKNTAVTSMKGKEMGTVQYMVFSQLTPGSRVFWAGASILSKVRCVCLFSYSLGTSTLAIRI